MHGFTLHFATINTLKRMIMETMENLFTLHFATINTGKLIDFVGDTIDLHYTLLLLILPTSLPVKLSILIYITLCYY